jgi:adenine deaminase
MISDVKSALRFRRRLPPTMSLHALSLSREPARQVAMGEVPADTVLINARVVHVMTGEIAPPAMVAIGGGRIAGVGDFSYAIGSNTRIIDAEEAFVVPGLIDGHMHVESAMMTDSAFSNAVLPYGTTAVFMDPHEIANVLGWEGLRLFYEEGYTRPPLKSSRRCRPASPQLPILRMPAPLLQPNKLTGPSTGLKCQVSVKS